MSIFPGEAAFVAIVELIKVIRQTTDPDILKRVDALNIRMAENAYETWERVFMQRKGEPKS
jgi:hypothetical protein